MKKLILVGVTLLASSVCWAVPVSKSKVAELAAHRIDRLVALGKIDAAFRTQMEKIEVTAAGPAPAAFNARVSQTQPAGAAAISVDLSFDTDGKPLAFKLIAGGVAGPNPQWPSTDANTLSENSLHYILDNPADVKLKPFADGLTRGSSETGSIISV